MFENSSDDFSLLLGIRSRTELNTSAEMLRWIQNSIIANTYKIFKDPFGVSNGYMIWANVNRETICRMSRIKLFPKYSYEWREGNIILILDLVFLDGWNQCNRRQLVKFIRHQRVFAFARRDKLSMFIRKKNRHRDIDIRQLPKVFIGQ